jgi:hypothetical protein
MSYRLRILVITFLLAFALVVATAHVIVSQKRLQSDRDCHYNPIVIASTQPVPAARRVGKSISPPSLPHLPGKAPRSCMLRPSRTEEGTRRGNRLRRPLHQYGLLLRDGFQSEYGQPTLRDFVI